MPVQKQISGEPDKSTNESGCAGNGLMELIDEKKKIGRPRKSKSDKYKSTHIRLHPKIVEWAKAEAERRGIGYQSVINETLLEQIPP